VGRREGHPNSLPLADIFPSASATNAGGVPVNSTRKYPLEPVPADLSSRAKSRDLLFHSTCN
jgi:hypothetical protein